MAADDIDAAERQQPGWFPDAPQTGWTNWHLKVACQSAVAPGHDRPRLVIYAFDPEEPLTVSRVSVVTRPLAPQGSQDSASTFASPAETDEP